MAEKVDAREAAMQSLSATPLRTALRPINVPRPSNLGPGADSSVFDDGTRYQNKALGTESNTTTRDYNSPLNPEHAPRETASFIANRFKTTGMDSNERASPGEPKAFARLRQSEAGNQSESPRTPGSATSKGTYDLFKTRSRKFSGPLEKIAAPLDRQLTRMRTRRHPAEEARPGAGKFDFVDVEAQEAAAKAAQREELQNRAQEENGGGMKTALSAGRYFDALAGPELEEVKDKESLLLPEHELWPFLLRFPIGTFGVALGLGSQTMLWKNLALVPEMTFLQVPMWINLVLWCTAVLALVVIFICYFLKIQYYFEAVRREYHHPVRVNFFFAPWIACMFLATGVPPQIATTIHPAVWCVFMFPVFCLELKIYGQWLSGGQRRLSKVANPSTHLSVVGNFVGSNLAAIVGWKEPAIFFWAVGLAHYIVLFVTLYQRLPTNETLPADLHPVFFLFVAAPSASSLAWMRISGEFDYVSRIVFFIALFLYTSLIVRINFFRGFKFSVAWWAYTFPMTAAAIASIQYAQVAPSWITRILALVLSLISSAMVCILFISTLLHMFYWGCLFPNDLAIAITAHKPKTFARVQTEGADKDDGCGLYSLQHSEPLYKSMLDAYHSFLAARERNEAVVMNQGQTSPEHVESSTSSDGSVNGNLLRRTPSP